MHRAAVFAIVFALGSVPLHAKGGPPRPGSAGGPPKPAGAAAPKSGPVAGAPKVQGAAKAPGTATKKGPATPAGGATKAGPKAAGATKSAGAAKTAQPSSTRAASGTAPAATNSRGATSTTTSTVTPESGTTPPAVLGPNVPKNPKLQAKLQAMLPPGTPLDVAAAGFKNQGQFVAALHVSNNLGVPFTELKVRMVDDGLSLGQAIQATKPSVDGVVEARRAQQQASSDLK